MRHRLLFLRRQLERAQENLELILERTSEFVLETEVPLQLVKEERGRRDEIADLEAQLELLKSDSRRPYCGLEPFELEQAEFFCGRDAMTQRLLEKVTACPLVTIVGPSGCGKSSLLRAGLCHLLKEGGESWLFAIARPERAPFHALARQLLPWIAPESSAVEGLVEVTKLASALASGVLDLDQVLSRTQDQHRRASLLVGIDQFEELYTQGIEPRLRERFIGQLLASLEHDHRLRVVLTLRADFYSHVLSSPRLGAAIDRGQVTVLPLTRDEMRQAIETPALTLGRTFEGGLVERVLNDIAGQPGDLPLLEFALTELWLRQNAQGVLSHRAYEEIGGVEKALADYAEAVFERLAAGDQIRARRVLIQLVLPGESTADLRRLATRSEVGEDNWDLVTQLADERLVVTGHDPATDEETVQLVHEALIEAWQRLSGWLDENRDLRTWQERLRADLRQWEASGRDDGGLLRGGPLQEALGWLAGRPEDLSAAEANYIRRSEAFEESELERERRRSAQLKRRLLYLAAALGLVVVLAVVAVFLAQARQEALTAEQLQTRIATSRLLALASRNRLEENKYELARLLSVEAYRTEPIKEARESLFAGYQNRLKLSKILHGHQKPVRSLVFDSDSKVLTSVDGSGAVFRRQTSPEEGTLLERQLRVMERGETAISPDGRWMATVPLASQLILLWDLVAGRPRYPPLFSPYVDASTLSFSRDGRKLAAATIYDTVQIWDLEQEPGHSLHITKHLSHLEAFAFSPDGELLALASCEDAGCSAAELALFHSSTGQRLGPPLAGHEGPVQSLVFTPDGQRIVVGNVDEGTLRLWDIKSRQALTLPVTGPLGKKTYSYTFSPRGIFASGGCQNETGGCSPGEIRFWNGKTLQHYEDGVFNGHEGKITSLLFYGDAQLASGAEDGSILLWDFSEEANLSIIGPHYGLFSKLAMTFDSGARLLASGGCSQRFEYYGSCAQNEIRLWDTSLRTFHGPKLIGHKDSEIVSLAFHPNGSLLASGDSVGSVLIWDLKKFEPHGDRLMLADESIQLSLAFSRDGRTLVMGRRSEDGQGALVLWDVVSQENRRSISHPYLFDKLLFSPDGRMMASAHDQDVQLWSYPELEIVGPPMKGHTKPISSLAFSPDGRLLASGDQDGHLIFWDVEQQEPLSPVIRGHESYILNAFSPDGEILATADWTGQIKLWDVATYQSYEATLQGHESFIHAIGFDLQGMLLTAGWDQKVHHWAVGAVPWQRNVCNTVGRNMTLDEWRENFQGQPYRTTCSNLPPHPTSLEPYVEEVKSEALDSEALVTALVEITDRSEKAVSHAKARRSAATVLRQVGEALAIEGEADAALARLNEAHELDHTTVPNPSEVLTWVLLRAARNAAFEGEVDRAVARYEEVLKLAPELEIFPSEELMIAALTLAETGDAFERVLPMVAEARRQAPQLEIPGRGLGRALLAWKPCWPSPRGASSLRARRRDSSAGRNLSR